MLKYNVSFLKKEVASCIIMVFLDFLMQLKLENLFLFKFLTNNEDLSMTVFPNSYIVLIILNMMALAYLQKNLVSDNLSELDYNLLDLPVNFPVKYHNWLVLLFVLLIMLFDLGMSVFQTTILIIFFNMFYCYVIDIFIFFYIINIPNRKNHAFAILTCMKA